MHRSSAAFAPWPTYQALAGLEEAHEAGEIPDSVYRDRRLRLKAQLRDVLTREGAV